METLRLPEIWKDDVAVEEADGVADEDMVVEIKPGNFGIMRCMNGKKTQVVICERSSWRSCPGQQLRLRVTSGAQSGISDRISSVWHSRHHGLPYMVVFRT
jgi:hypothetical protein